MINAERGRSFEQITVGSTIGQLTWPTTFTPVRGTFTLETAQIRFAYHEGSTELTAADRGHVMDAGDAFTLEGTENLRAFRHIRTGSTSGVLNVTLEAQ